MTRPLFSIQNGGYFLTWTATDVSPTNHGLLGIADATGHLQVRNLDQHLQLAPLVDIEVNSDKSLCLSLDWTTRTGSDARAVISQSNGTLALIHSLEKPLVETWDAHGYESWICAWSRWNDNIVWSGASY